MPGAPGSGRGAPMFEETAQAAIAATRPRTQPWPPHAMMSEIPDGPSPLTEKERAEAEKAKVVCEFCLGYHALPNSAGCPRLASFELDGDGRVKSGTFFEGTKWAKGRVVFVEDVHEEGDGDDGN